MKAKPPIRERSIQNEIMRAFSTLPGMRLWRANTGAATYGDRMVRYGVPGQADLSGILPRGVRLEIECKRPGQVPTEDQVNFGKTITRFGGVYIVAYSAQDVEAALHQRGFTMEMLRERPGAADGY